MDTIPIPAPKGGGILKLIGTGFLSLFIILILIDVVYVSLQEKSFYPVLKEVGSRLLYATQSLSLESKKIIAQEGLYKATDDFWTGIWEFLKTLAVLFIATYSIYSWIKIFMVIFAYTPLSDATKSFNNLLFALITFIALQSMLLVITAAVNNQIDGFTDTPNSAMHYMFIPISCMIDFIKALIYIIPSNMRSSRVI